MPTTRTRGDRCPGVLRPWPADDGALVRLRLVGGRIASDALAALSALAVEHGDGDLHLTGRANLQLRALPAPDGRLPAPLVHGFESAGLLPSRSHELVRNLMVSPQSGLAGGRADLRPVAGVLDRRLCADARLAGLPGRFLFVLDDGRGDLAGRPLDLGLVALDHAHAQVRVGTHGWGEVVGLDEAAAYLLGLAHAFLDARGEGPQASWHVDELSSPLTPARPCEPGAAVTAPALAYGAVPGGTHVAAPGGALGPALVADLARSDRMLVVTPWHGILVPA